ncbi:hypothetical protein PSU4_32150 [Pseudonocardia sulfidoxydans NBRC 16205]|uniref:CBS domain-containing protein n=2 Tax=Pseudonocardia sulfidoxydans TaxID=54011 RepID=A0A511DHJ9_9PSEU|nr:CBS domain-containing protein [Pseudonocardia sulfidoxydans]GEL24261.1 hypothetical protein PSU4_32150 [Pseudonocardia sulfidoxydans NBRC 16205]
MTLTERPVRPEAADDDPAVRSVMSTYLVGIVPGASLRVALRLMVARHVRHLPVIDGPADRRCHRLVAEADVLRGLVASHGPFGTAPLHVEDVARTAGVVGPVDRLSDAARIMHETGADAVLVEDRGELAGIVTVRDVVAASARGVPRPR